jgi:hypothetical protein
MPVCMSRPKRIGTKILLINTSLYVALSFQLSTLAAVSSPTEAGTGAMDSPNLPEHRVD